MTTLDRTAYPHLNKPLTERELAACYTLDDREKAFINHNARGDRGPLVLAILLKTRQQLGYFVPLTQVPVPVTRVVADTLWRSNHRVCSHEANSWTSNLEALPCLG